MNIYDKMVSGKYGKLVAPHIPREFKDLWNDDSATRVTFVAKVRRLFRGGR